MFYGMICAYFFMSAFCHVLIANKIRAYSFNLKPRCMFFIKISNIGF